MTKRVFADDPPPYSPKPKKVYGPNDPREPIIIRIRARRGMLRRIHAIVEHDRDVYREHWTLSDALREVIADWCGRREAEIAAARAAGFTGRPPIDLDDDEDGDLDLDTAPAIRVTG
jgi:hypothetical protein